MFNNSSRDLVTRIWTCPTVKYWTKPTKKCGMVISYYIIFYFMLEITVLPSVFQCSSAWDHIPHWACNHDLAFCGQLYTLYTFSSLLSQNSMRIWSWLWQLLFLSWFLHIPSTTAFVHIHVFRRSPLQQRSGSFYRIETPQAKLLQPHQSMWSNHNNSRH